MREGRTWAWFPWSLWVAVWAFHLVTLHTLVPGLHHDEAYNALDALRIGKDGYWPVFLPENFGREPLMVYVMALGFRLFGPSVWATRLPAAVAWGLTYPALYWLLLEIFPHMPRDRRARVWMAATLVFLSSVWYVAAARMAIRTSWFVLLETLFFAGLLRTWRTGELVSAVFTGVIGGLLFYTYLPNRMIPLVLAGALAIAVSRHRAQLRQRASRLLLVAAIAALVMVPEALYFLRHPDAFGLRTSQVLVVKPGQPLRENLRALGQNALQVVSMFVWHGDENQRSNVPGRPVLTTLGLPLFLVGIVRCLLRRSAADLLLLTWFTVMLFPTWLTDNAPNFQRALGAFPPFVLILGLGADQLWEWVARLAPPGLSTTKSGGVAGALVGTLLLGEAVLSFNAWWAWQRQPYMFYAFDEGLSAIGQFLADLPPQTRVYESPRSLQHPTLRYFLFTDPTPPRAKSFDGRSVIVARPGEDVTYVVITHEDFRFPVIAPWVWPGITLSPVRQFTDREGNVYAQVFHVPASQRPRGPRFPVNALWEDHVQLLGYEPIGCCRYHGGDIIYLELWWTAQGQPPEHDWTVFTHLLDAQGRLVIGRDGPPGEGSFPTSTWEPGEWVITEYPLILPQDLPPGEYTLEVGLYDWRTGKRLPLRVPDGDALMLGKVEVVSR